MAYCNNCGQKNPDGAAFCSACGQTLSSFNQKEHRTTVYEGTLHKCPNCGEILNSLLAICPSCGKEIRGVASSENLRIFSNNLAQQGSLQQQARFIRYYIVPNTREDLFEFANLALINIKNHDIDSDGVFTVDEMALVEAWKSLLEQCRNKSEMLFKSNSSEFENISNMYQTAEKVYSQSKNMQQRHDSTQKITAKIKKLLSKKATWICTSIILVIAVVGCMLLSSNIQKNKLDSIITAVEEKTQNKDYSAALELANQILPTAVFINKTDYNNIRKRLIDNIEEYKLNDLIDLVEEQIEKESYEEALVNAKKIKPTSSFSKKNHYDTIRLDLVDKIEHLIIGVKRVIIDEDSESLCGKTCEEVKSILISMSFRQENISAITYGKPDRAVRVLKIQISGKDTFAVGEMFYDDAQVELTCEKYIVIGVDYETLKDKEHYEDAVRYLRDKGFTNITCKGYWHATNTIFLKKNAIYSISINNFETFAANSEFLSSVEIIITYVEPLFGAS